MSQRQSYVSRPSNILKPRNYDETPSGKMNARRTSSTSSTVKRGSKYQNSEPPKRISFGQMSNRLTPSRSNATHLPVPSSSGRHSIDSQRSSVGVGGSKFSRKEVRPVATPAFKNKCIDNVLEFMLTTDSSGCINRKSLITPSNRDFVHMMNTIYSVLVPNFSLQNPFENQICEILKSLKYPVQIPKSSFKTVGSSHAWPNILCMLSWLVDLTKSKKSQTSDIEDAIFSVDSAGERLYFECATSVYNAQSEDDSEHYIQEYKKLLLESYNFDSEYEARAKEQIDMIDREICELEELPDRAMIYEKQYEDLLGDIKNLETYSDELTVHKNAKIQQAEALNPKIAEAENKVLVTEEALQELMELKQQQNLSVNDIRQMKLKAEEMSRSSDRLKQENHDLCEAVWKIEMQIGKNHESIQNKIRTFNCDCLELDLEDFKITSSGAELAEELREKEQRIKDFNKDTKQETFSVDLQLEQELQNYNKVQEIHDDKEMEKKRLESKIRRLEEEFKCTKDRINNKEKDIHHELETLHEKLITEKKKYNSSTFESNKTLLESLQQDLVKKDEANKQRMKDGATFIIKACQMILKDNERRNEMFTKFSQNIELKCINFLKDTKDKFKKGVQD